ncbi:hypothetical protein EAS68_00470 [Legionella jordanis]|uniref:hypothetical protein n=1 Tax=Legionella jordanis TaxID=456 RepID=UPI000F001C75|nr:hypothetical protein [Legionella jordanis]RMX22038.1 hypothetical protein EAS68_00470 [Legionella jordanis]
MKRLFVLSLLFPVLASCAVENGYYGDPYYRPAPRAQVETPYGYRGNPRGDIPYDDSYYGSQSNTHHHYSQADTVAYGQTVARKQKAAPRNRNHGHNRGNERRHQNQPDVRTHRRGDNRAEVQVHGHEQAQNSSVHGHKDYYAPNVHGHD